jgi:hypothetical protein
VNSCLKYLLLLAVLYVTACEKDSGREDFFLVEVVEKGIDCGETYLIKFQEEDEKRVNKYLEHTNAYFPVFYADNLPEKFKVKGWILKVKLHKYQHGELPACSSMGPGLGHVFIESAETVSLALPWMFF